MTEEEKRERKKIACKKWREKNPNYHIEYYKKNKDRVAEYQKKYHEEHYDADARKKYYEEHKEEIYKQQTEYRHKNSKKVSQMVLNCKRRKVAKLREQGIKNAWAVVNYKSEPKYYKKIENNSTVE